MMNLGSSYLTEREHSEEYMPHEHEELHALAEAVVDARAERGRAREAPDERERTDTAR